MIAEVLNCLLLKAKEEVIIEEVKVGRNNIDISHLQFADDTLIFSPANSEIF